MYYYDTFKLSTNGCLLIIFYDDIISYFEELYEDNLIPPEIILDSPALVNL